MKPSLNDVKIKNSRPIETEYELNFMRFNFTIKLNVYELSYHS